MRTTSSPTEFLRIAGLTAEHFGFQSIDALSQIAECKNCTVPLTHSIGTTDHNVDAVHGHLTRGVLTYCEAGLHAYGKPVFLYTIDTTHSQETALSLHIFNVQKSIAEAILIQTMRAIASELGHNEHVVRINSLGDSESMVRYSRELNNFLRKRIDSLSLEAREAMKIHSILALQTLIAEDHDLVHKSPNPLEYLSDQSRKHFRDIIEYLDMSETPYEIDSKMISGHEYYSDALFSIDNQGSDESEGSVITLRGGRFDSFLERKTKRKTGGVGAVAILEEKPAPARLPRIKLEAPNVYIIQLGFGPKVRSLLIIDQLRRSGISVIQDLANDSLSAQLRDAENRGVKHVIIIGQKEFVDGTVILRDMDARKQESIPYDSIVRRLRKNVTIPA